MSTYHSTLLERLAKAHYAATPEQVEQLAAELRDATTAVSRGSGAFLRILLTACQAKLGKMRRGPAPKPDAQEAVLTGAYETYFPAVLKGIMTPEIEITDTALDEASRRHRIAEKHRRTTFARTAKSTLLAAIRAKVDLRALDATTVTKAQLRELAAPATARQGVSRDVVRFATQGLLRAIAKRADGDIAVERERLEQTIAVLRVQLTKLEERQVEAAANDPSIATLTTRRAARAATRRSASGSTATAQAAAA